jgi:RNA polymerase sigma factor (sigma-70 family)
MRIVLHLRYGENMRLENIARALGVTKGTVSSRLSRAQKQLKQWMEQEGY